MSAPPEAATAPFVVDARDYLTDTELVRVQAWKPSQVDDEVLDRVKTALAKRSDHIDSPREHMRPVARPLGHSGVAGQRSIGMSL